MPRACMQYIPSQCTPHLSGTLRPQALAKKVLTDYGFDLVSKSPAIFTEDRPQQAMLLYPRAVLGTALLQLITVPAPGLTPGEALVQKCQQNTVSLPPCDVVVCLPVSFFCISAGFDKAWLGSYAFLW